MPDSGSAYSFSIFSDLLIKNCTNNLSKLKEKKYHKTYEVHQASNKMYLHHFHELFNKYKNKIERHMITVII